MDLGQPWDGERMWKWGKEGKKDWESCNEMKMITYHTVENTYQ